MQQLPDHFLLCEFWPKISENARKTAENRAEFGQKVRNCEFWPKISENPQKTAGNWMEFGQKVRAFFEH